MEFLFETIRLGLSNLRVHFLRSVLTALGIILGVAAVITMVSIGEGAKQAALDQIERLGARNIILRSVKPAQSAEQNGGNRRGFQITYGLTRADFDLIKGMFPDAAAIVPLKSIGAEVLKNERKLTSQAFGTTPEFLDVSGSRVARGRFLSEQDVDSRVGLAVLGSQIAADLFPTSDPIGQTLRIDAQVFEIIGVMAPVGLSGGAGAALVGRDLNNDVYIPVTTARDRFNDLVVRRASGQFSAEQIELSEIYFEAPTRPRVLVDAERVKRLLEMRHDGMTDVDLVVPYELLETANRQALQSNILTGSIAGISMLVGGIGIMNIMLASVQERTREIGIRRALGATRDDIVRQFLIETGVISMLGGVIGVGLGIALTVGVKLAAPWIASQIGTEAVHSQLALWSVGGSFVVATAIGLAFGIYPAMVAARQDPIVALRHD